MYQSETYPPPTEEEILRLVGEAFHGKLIAADRHGDIFASLLPFRFELGSEGFVGSTFEIHMVRADRTFQAIAETGKAGLLVDDPLAFTPHDLVDPEDASMATLHFEAVLFRCDATLTTDPKEVAAVLARLVAAKEPGASYLPVEDGKFYGHMLRMLAAARLTVREVEAKWKIAQSKPDDVVERLVRHLQKKGDLRSLHAARVLERDRLHKGGGPVRTG